ncbi:Lytic transglycosylase domain-containing protein [Rhodovastum atsumiense]|nr:transglycosylase SLT domain-containing protein [Rhodovastum atsumiense]CAH2601081.1 Lytic transglycosylase domain-containing protein [Rhodovastum atsumiense]
MRRRGLRALAWLAALAVFAAPSAGRAAGAADAAQAALCTTAVQAAEARHDLPRGLLGTIAKVESGRPVTAMNDIRPWPWTINAEGTGLFFDSRAAAVAWAEQALARGVRSLDVGCMQVNLQAHPDAFRSLDEAFDPQTNATYAARFLRRLATEAQGDWNIAAGLYHSHTPELAASYRDRVAAMGAGIISGIGGPEPLYQRALRQGTLRLALAGGGVLVVNTTRQPRARPQRRRSACEVAAVLAPLLHTPPRPQSCRVAAR